MTRPVTVSLFLCVNVALCSALTQAGSWSQFRGPNATGRPDREAPLPDKAGPEDNLVWKAPLPTGHSSPAISGDSIFVTGLRNAQLVTIGLDRRTGAIRWEAIAPHERLEEFHSVGNPAQSSPATDGSRVVSFFGSAGLYCYDMEGKPLWQIAMGPFKNDFGAGSSPIIVDDRVLLCQDHDTDSFLMAVDKHSGEVLWKVDRSEFPRNYCTPIIWNVGGRKQVVVAATLRIVAYDFETGAELWSVGGVARIINMTPVVGDDGLLYAACWSPGGDETDRITADPFADVIAQLDANGNGALEKDEAPEGAVKQRFTQIDRDKDGRITQTEYESMRRVFESARNGIVAIKPGGTGDITATRVAWRHNKLLPYCPSPLYLRGEIFMVKDGGIYSVTDAASGQTTRQGRLKATGGYFSSPVAGDGKVYTVSQRGELTILDADNDWQEIWNSELGENAFATPAIADGRLYVRTSGHLFCFGKNEK
ncbi:MAG: PQQ-binding-like beta-propeller repeat protein [Planctomycetales bacterium]